MEVPPQRCSSPAGDMGTKQRVVRASLVNLHLFVPWRDVRRLIYRQLSPLDVELALMAHSGASCAALPLPQTLSLCPLIAQYGTLAQMQWARDNGCRWDERTTAACGKAGNLEMLRYAAENRCEWGPTLVLEAARHGHRHIIQWAFDNAKGDVSVWHPNTAEAIAETGDLEMLVWAFENGCPKTWKAAYDAAKRAGHEPVVKWLDANRWSLQPMRMM